MMLEIRGLSVKQPWANMIMSGQKKIETRTQRTHYRGNVLICSSQSPRIDPWGCALGMVSIVGCRDMTEDDEQAAMCAVYENAKCWMLGPVFKFETPFSLKGRLGLWNLTKAELVMTFEQVLEWHKAKGEF